MLLSNVPGFGDPNVIDPESYTMLSFDYNFAEGFNNNDEFRVNLLNGDTGDSFFDVDFSFSTAETESGTETFDISSFVGSFDLGLQFELSSNDLPLLDSTVTISNLQLNTVSAPIPEPSTIYSFLLGSLLLLLVKHRFR